MGTGTNTCYIENNEKITENKDLDPAKSQIINVESGAFGKAPRTEIDLKFDESTTNPGQYAFEKIFSGGYLEGLALTVLKMAAEEGYLSETSAESLLSVDEISTDDGNRFLDHSCSDHGKLLIFNLQDL